MAANLICPKKNISEGFARLLTKSDVAMLTRKDRILDINGAEMIMQEAWQLLAAKIDNDDFGVPERNQLFGVLSSRLACHLTKKGKDSIEGVQYKTTKEIKAKFQHDLNVALGVAAAEPPAAESSAPAPLAACATTLDDAANPQWIAKQAGFIVGKLYKLKPVATDNKPLAQGVSFPWDNVYKIDSMGHTSASFVLQQLNRQELVQKAVAYEDLDAWMEFRGKLLEIIHEDKVVLFIASSQANFEKDVRKAALFMALVEISQQKFGDLQLTYVLPCHVQAKDGIPKGALSLYPVTELSKINPTSVTAQYVVTGHGQSFCLDAPRKIHKVDDDAKKTGAVFAGFW